MTRIKFFYFLLFTFYFLTFTPGASADFLNQNSVFNVNSEYEYLGRDKVSATLVKISDKAHWYVSDEYLNQLSDLQKSFFLQKLDQLAAEFDSRIYPIETSFWGLEPNPGIDNDPRVVVLISRLVDFAGGYFDSGNLYRKDQFSGSNEREMVFLNSNSLANDRAKIFLAHEFQHLIAFYQKDFLRNSNEDTWLNETRAEYAPRLLGYDDFFETSNIRRRMFAFAENPSDPLGEWKNQSSDYGAIALFMNYLADQYGSKILLDTLKSGKSGIDSINEFLELNGFSERFSDVFSNWTIANAINDESASPRFAYKFPVLQNFKISSSQNYNISGLGSVVSVSNSVKNWQPVWYEFNTSVSLSSDLNLKIQFSGDTGANFKVPYVVFKINGQKQIGFLPLNNSNGEFFFKNFGGDIHKMILIPASHSKTSSFTDNDPSFSFSLSAEITDEYREIAPLTSPSVQLSIEDLMKQIVLLQSQIDELKKKSVPALKPFSLNRDLSLGARGDDVKSLQEFLIKQGVYPEAKITGYFGPLTKNAVIRFQQKHGISPQLGYVGSKTRTKINELVILVK